MSEPDMLALQPETNLLLCYSGGTACFGGQDFLDQFSAGELRRYLEAWVVGAETNSQGVAALRLENREELVEAVLTPLLARCREIDPAFSYSWSGVDVCRYNG